MSVNISKSLGQYIRVVNKIENRNPYFQRNLATNLTYSIESLAQAYDAKSFQKIIENFNEAPRSLFKTFSSVLLAQNPKNISELQNYRKSLKVICRRNPDAKAYLTQFRSFLLEKPENQRLIDFIGKGSKNYINAHLGKHFQSPFTKPHSDEFLTASKNLLADLSHKSLRTHLNNFFDYILNNGAVQNAAK